MIQIVETTLKVSFKYPYFFSTNSVVNSFNCVMTIPFRSKTIRSWFKLGFSLWFKSQSSNILIDSIFHSWYSERSKFTVLLFNIRPISWFGSMRIDIHILHFIVEFYSFIRSQCFITINSSRSFPLINLGDSSNGE